jgi:hypothetical protein
MLFFLWSITVLSLKLKAILAEKLKFLATQCITMTSYEVAWGVRFILDLMLCTNAGDTVLRLNFCRKNSRNDCSCCNSDKYCGEERIMLRNSRSSSLSNAPSKYIFSLRRKSCSLLSGFITRRFLKNVYKKVKVCNMITNK